MKPQPGDLKTICDFCGAEFIPSADSFCEGGIEMCDESIEPWTEEEQKAQALERAEIRQHIKSGLGLTDEQADEVLSTGKVENLAWCVCDKCQEEGAEPEEGEKWKEEEGE